MATTEKSACLSKSGRQSHRIGRGKVTSAEAPDREQHEHDAFLDSVPALSTRPDSAGARRHREPAANEGGKPCEGLILQTQGC